MNEAQVLKVLQEGKITMPHQWKDELKSRGFAHFRLRGMIGNLKEIINDTALSDHEIELVDFAREILEQLDADWGKIKWNPK